MSSWRWYHIVVVWVVAIVGCIALFRATARQVEGESDSGSIVGVGIPLWPIVTSAVVLIALMVITAKWIRAR